jgi:RES domain-containing protein
MYLWRVAVETPEWEAHDLGGREVKDKGGRWSQPGTPLVYACTTIGIACLETLVHLAPGEMPANRYLVRVSVPPGLWASRTRFELEPGWDAEPPGRVSQTWGMRWIDARASLLAAVPSVIAPEETNVLINPRHPDARQLTATKLRRWNYDLRLLARRCGVQRAEPPAPAKSAARKPSR